MIVLQNTKVIFGTQITDFSQSSWVRKCTMLSSCKEITFLSKNWDAWYREPYFQLKGLTD